MPFEPPERSAPDAREIAEVLWLAARLADSREDPVPSPAATRPHSLSGITGPVEPGVPRRARDRSTERDASDGPGHAPSLGLPGHAPQLHVQRVRAPAHHMGPALPALPVRSPGVRPLPKAVELGKALRPLRRRAPSAVRQRLDEEATAERAAQTDVWEPVLVPEDEPWLDLLLVVDTGESMVLWDGAVAELRTVLRRVGAFRSITVRWLEHLPDGRVDVRGTPPPWTGGASRRVRDPGRQVQHSPRGALLVLSDAINTGWRSGAVDRLLARWARSRPTAVVQPLDRRLWHRTALRPLPVTLKAARPGAPNSDLRTDTDHPHPLVPVVELAPSALQMWARMVAQPETSPFQGYAVCPLADVRPVTAPPELGSTPADEPGLSPLDRVLAFRAAASPQAFELAGYLSAAPLFLPVMRLVQKVMAPRTTPSHLAEVFLSGLLHPVHGDRPGPGEETEFDFPEPVRALLLGSLHRQESRRVLTAVSDYLAEHSSAPYRFDATLADPAAELPSRISSESLPFAKVDAAVADALGGGFATRARKLRSLISGHSPRRGNGDGTSPYDYVVTDTTSIQTSAEAEAGRFHQAGADAHTAGAHAPTGEPSGQPAEREAPVAESASRLAEVDGPASTMATSGGPLQTITRPMRFEQNIPQVWGRRIPPRNHNFTGRDELITQLHARLEDRRAAIVPQAFFGLGGVGKTQLAVEYIYRYQSQYQLIWWINAEDPAVVRSSIAALAPHLGLQAPSGDEALPLVLNALRLGSPYRRWLLVFDNADRPEDLEEYFPSGEGHILITSRNQSWAGHAHPVSVDVFSREESIRFLQRRVPGMPAEDASRLAEALGDLPLAIEQAGAWHAETAMSVDEYLQLLREHASRLLDTSVPSGYPHSVVATWNLAMERLAQRNPAAVQLLRLCSCMAPEPISWSLLRSAAFAPLPSPLAEALRDPVELGLATREIGRLALARIDHRSNSLQMHRLVQAVLFNQMTPQEQEDTYHLTHVLLAAADPQDPEDNDNWRRYAELRPHIRPTRAVECDYREVRDLVINEVRYLYLHGDYTGGTELAEFTRKEWQQRLGEDHPQTMRITRSYANLIRNFGRFEEARDINADLLERTRRVFGEDHEETLAIANSSAGDLRVLGDFEQAAGRDADTLERLTRSFGRDYPLALMSAANHALDLRLLGRFQEALELDADTYERRVRIFGPDDPITLVVAANYARDQRELGDYRGSTDSLRALYPKLRDSQGREHPYTLDVAKNLAVSLRAMGAYEEAYERSARTVERYRARYGEGDLNTLAAVGNYAVDLLLRSELEEAESLAAQTVAGYEQLFGASHPYVPMTETNHALVLSALGEHERALSINLAAHEKLGERFGPEHNCTLRCGVNLANDLHAAGRFDEAAQGNTWNLQTLRATLGPDHPVTLVCGGNLAHDLKSLGRDEEAATLLDEVLERFTRTLGRDYPVAEVFARGERAFCDIETPVF
ncbi:FxSxx-COOH system tetratricopeptide repeat protein [Streptomyces sp. TP-A0356]|uniref:FxSxx-COOH system tetratricopeptide repeat protein n=1 Tax=Streptomyces sp. TP-A0356 TaxID=1359208 RepID=UPI0006E30057|nr:FxSxx-COOH system tetratricopeptide repeat protein [Streptomyces sp. TP-A0356]